MEIKVYVVMGEKAYKTTTIIWIDKIYESYEQALSAKEKLASEYDKNQATLFWIEAHTFVKA